MAITIGHKGYVDLLSSTAGSKRKLRIVSFTGLAAAGGVLHQQFDNKMQPVAVFDMSDGKTRTAEFSDTGDTLGQLTQIDTGPSGHVCWAVFSDTGIA
jgi:hypothetical protein